MGFTSLDVVMDSADWFQGTIHEDSGMDSSSPSGDMLTCSRPIMDRRLRPQQDQALKCPRCESTHTKFCYYNNYSLSQPRYFCKTCRRYWTKGGTLRNIPVGGGCRKNKKVSNKKGGDQQCNNNNNNNQNHVGSSNDPNDLQLSHLNNVVANQGTLGISTSYVENYPSRPIDFMESKWENVVGSYRSNYNYFMGNSQDDIGMVSGLGDHNIGHHGLPLNFHGFCSPYGINSFETGQNLMLPYHDQVSEDQNGIDVKPNPKLLSLEWQDQGGCDGGKDTFGHYGNNLGSSWNGIMNNYGPSTTNSLV